MDVPQHVLERLRERKLNFSQIMLLAIARDCERDTAILLKKFENRNNEMEKIPHYLREESNGDLVILVVRDKTPITVMFRRSDQPFTPQALRVHDIKIWY